MSGWKLCVGWLGVFVVTCAVMAAGPATKPGTATLSGPALHSLDGRILIVLPEAYIVGDAPPREPGKLPFEFMGVDLDDAAFVMGWTDVRVPDIKAHAEAMREKTLKQPGVEKASDAKVMRIGGFRAYRWEVTGTANGKAFGGVWTMIETPSRFVTFCATTTGAKFASAKPQLEAIAEGVHEVEVKSITMRSADGHLEANLPGGWAPVVPPKAGYDLQATSDERREVMLVGSTTKPAKPDLEAFAERVRGGTVAALSDVKVTDFAKVDVNGRPALRCQIVGNRKGVSIGYIVTAVDLPTRLMVVLAVSDGQGIAERKADLEALAGMIHELEVKPTVAAAKVAAPAAGSGTPLEQAMSLKASDPAAAYAALRAIVRTSPKSDDAKAASKELEAMEADPALVKRILAGEGKAYGHYQMAQNFTSMGKGDMARARYEQLLRDYPDTLSAHLAVKKMEDALK